MIPGAEDEDPTPMAALDLDRIFADLSDMDQAERAALALRHEPKHDVTVRATYAPSVASDEHADTLAAFVPSLDPEYLIDSAQLEAIRRVIAVADSTGQPQNIGLHGPAGSGKTTMAIQIGAIRRAPTFVIDSSDKQTADEWFGTQTIADGTIEYHVSDFVRGLETPGSVVILDDVALLQSRTIQNGLNAILDPSRRSIFIQSLGRTVTVAPGVCICGTWNVGDEYSSASDLSAQILDRFRAGAMFEVPFPSNGALTHVLSARTGLNTLMAQRLANLAEWLRGDADPIFVSTRGLIAAGHHIVSGASVGHAVFYTVLGDCDASERARAYGIIDVALGGCDDDERALWATPVSGDYVRLGDVYSDSTPDSTPDSTDSEGSDNDNA
jgi:hypothetical protein